MSDSKPSGPSGVDDYKVLDEQATAPETRFEKEQDQVLADYSKEADTSQLSMEVKVYSPSNDYYEGRAFSVSAENTTGAFDVLPKHHNFITLLNACDLIIRTSHNRVQKIKISGGLMHVKADKVIVFLDI